MKFVLKTITSLSDRMDGPYDLALGRCSTHPDLIVEAETSSQAWTLFSEKFPDDIQSIEPLYESITEYILSAAIMIRGTGLIISLPKPARHSDIVHAYNLQACPERQHHDPEFQGFITSTGRYVGRKEAVYVARRAEQLTLPKICHPMDELFSEDLW